MSDDSDWKKAIEDYDNRKKKIKKKPCHFFPNLILN